MLTGGYPRLDEVRSSLWLTRSFLFEPTVARLGVCAMARVKGSALGLSPEVPSSSLGGLGCDVGRHWKGNAGGVAGDVAGGVAGGVPVAGVSLPGDGHPGDARFPTAQELVDRAPDTAVESPVFLPAGACVYNGISPMVLAGLVPHEMARAAGNVTGGSAGVAGSGDSQANTMATKDAVEQGLDKTPSELNRDLKIEPAEDELNNRSRMYSIEEGDALDAIEKIAAMDGMDEMEVMEVMASCFGLGRNDQSSDAANDLSNNLGSTGAHTGLNGGRHASSVNDDGYNWRKYGEKNVKGSKYPRSYYKCSTQGCTMKKIVERDPVSGIISHSMLKGEHNHPMPNDARAELPPFGKRPRLSNRRKGGIGGIGSIYDANDPNNVNNTSGANDSLFSSERLCGDDQGNVQAHDPDLRSHDSERTQDTPITSNTTLTSMCRPKRARKASIKVQRSSEYDISTDAGPDIGEKAYGDKVSTFQMPSSYDGGIMNDDAAVMALQLLGTGFSPDDVSGLELPPGASRKSMMPTSFDMSPSLMWPKKPRGKCGRPSLAAQAAKAEMGLPIDLLDLGEVKSEDEWEVDEEDFGPEDLETVNAAIAAATAYVNKISTSSKGRRRRSSLPVAADSTRGIKAGDSGGPCPSRDLNPQSSIIGIEDIPAMDGLKPHEADAGGHTEPLKTKAARAKAQPTDKLVVRTETDNDQIEDGYKWRKYGQKIVKGNPHPRSYYKCTYEHCKVRKQVERAGDNVRILVTTYEGMHSHDPPASKKSSTVMAKPSKVAGDGKIDVPVLTPGMSGPGGMPLNPYYAALGQLLSPLSLMMNEVGSMGSPFGNIGINSPFYLGMKSPAGGTALASSGNGLPTGVDQGADVQVTAATTAATTLGASAAEDVTPGHRGPIAPQHHMGPLGGNVDLVMENLQHSEQQARLKATLQMHAKAWQDAFSTGTPDQRAALGAQLQVAPVREQQATQPSAETGPDT